MLSIRLQETRVYQEAKQEEARSVEGDRQEQCKVQKHLFLCQ
ncbi:MAG: hypothetical protein SFW36_02515 [Leptolyngbyaceae cyanobacterium bins.59]|nr:hypothetical protein [Leptolyngbyaceae cyanobacterium bins.59]